MSEHENPAGAGRGRPVSVIEREDRPLDEGRWDYLESGPRTLARGEDAFERAYAILDYLPDSDLASIETGPRLLDALGELTGHGACHPTRWWDLQQATEATTATAALDDAVAAINELLEDSTDLRTTLDLTRARSIVLEVRDTLTDTVPDPAQPTLPGAGAGGGEGA